MPTTIAELEKVWAIPATPQPPSALHTPHTAVQQVLAELDSFDLPAHVSILMTCPRAELSETLHLHGAAVECVPVPVLAEEQSFRP